jgi:hypothetical protein
MDVAEARGDQVAAAVADAERRGDKRVRLRGCCKAITGKFCPHLLSPSTGGENPSTCLAVAWSVWSATRP